MQGLRAEHPGFGARATAVRGGALRHQCRFRALDRLCVCAACKTQFYAWGAGDGLGFDGSGDPQFDISAVVEPGCDTAEPDGEFDADPLL